MTAVGLKMKMKSSLQLLDLLVRAWTMNMVPRMDPGQVVYRL